MKKQYIEYGAGCGGLKRVMALYEDGVLVKRIKMSRDFSPGEQYSSLSTFLCFIRLNLM